MPRKTNDLTTKLVRISTKPLTPNNTWRDGIVGISSAVARIDIWSGDTSEAMTIAELIYPTAESIKECSTRSVFNIEPRCDLLLAWANYRTPFNRRAVIVRTALEKASGSTWHS